MSKSSGNSLTSGIIAIDGCEHQELLSMPYTTIVKKVSSVFIALRSYRHTSGLQVLALKTGNISDKDY